jgi:hypothetical protein
MYIVVGREGYFEGKVELKSVLGFGERGVTLGTKLIDR